MIRLGLTGSIAMGKTTVANMLRERGIPVHDSDAVVHRLMSKGGEAVAPVLELFPHAADDAGGINRKAIAADVFKHPEKRAKLEAIIHPLVRHDRESWADYLDDDDPPIIVFDIPLLFETGSENFCDYVVTVSAPLWVQKKRAMLRDGMTDQKFSNIVRAQTPDAEKQKLSDYVIPTAYGKMVTGWYIDQMISDILLRETPDA
jgi:dephospho-CoA kinase